MEFQAAAALSFIKTTAPIAAVFIALAIATKGPRVMAAFRRCRHEVGTNIVLVLINYVLLAPFYAVAAGAVALLVPQLPALVAFWDGLWAPVTVLAAVLVVDFTAYWRHRFEHDPSLWPIHATHHSDEAMHWLSVTRKHPLSRLFSLVLDDMLAIALGIPIWAIIVANLLRTWWGYFAHADVPWTLGPLGKIMMSPAAHRLHHIDDEELMGTNYANTVTLFDRMFGTWCDPTPYLGCKTGIAAGTRGPIGELARPFEAIAARFGRRGLNEPAGDI
ncbi:sterol desaturase family protein [Croceicoccus mobilis]|uniref:Fatty acid hydroxylase n=1 Tax=Croceicoccus mobilis TaxID=1703339 RepID=A0A916YVN2_9SPHN|nr:sterol desaturase family protein [Croceicoccus mobilis]GGD63204.1 fatty acid hydroxylase [Croceicoccus mobilis]